MTYEDGVCVMSRYDPPNPWPDGPPRPRARNLYVFISKFQERSCFCAGIVSDIQEAAIVDLKEYDVFRGEMAERGELEIKVFKLLNMVEKGIVFWEEE